MEREGLSMSVVICARDEAGNLAKNLPGSLVQQYAYPFEIIVVNDNSIDDSKYVLEEYQKTFEKLRIIPLTQEAKLIPGKKFPLSIGIKSAAFDTVLLTDADCVPASENWIQSMEQCYTSDTEIILGYGAYHKKNTFFNKLIRWETFHAALQYLSYSLAGIPYMGVGRNLSYKKNLFLRNKGFSSHNHIMGGDDDLFINMVATGKNTKINIDPDSFTLSSPPETPWQWIRQKQRHYSTSRHYKKKHQWLLGIYSVTHFLFYPLFFISIFVNAPIALSTFLIRLIIQTYIYFSATKKLNEKDLFGFFILFDILMFFYYLFFSFSLFKKNKPVWK